MSFQEIKGLNKFPLFAKLGLTAFLVVAGIGYLLGFVNIYLSYAPVDGKAGMSLADISIAFHGGSSGSTLEKAIGGGMKTYLSSPADGDKIVSWIKGGGSESNFAQVKPIFDNSCNSCHSKDVKTAGVVLETYADVAPLLAADSGKSFPRLVTLSHIHVNGTLPLIFLLALVFAFTLFSDKVKTWVILFGFASIVLDIGSWWLAKAAGPLAITVVFGGICLAVTFLLMILLSLYDLWLRKKA